MPPAARVGDMHVCPMVTVEVPHVGGPILPPGSPQVLIGMMPAARISDMCVCVGPPDIIAMGSPTVLIGGMMAARLGDPTVHGGSIVMGYPQVMIGEFGSGSLGGGLGGLLMGLAMAGLAALKRLLGLDYPRQEIGPDGKVVTRYNSSITIKGSPEYQAAVVADLDRLAATETGKEIIDAMSDTGHSLTIEPIPPGSDQSNGFCDYVDPADNAAGRGRPNADGTPGAGADGVIQYNPSGTSEYTGADGNTYTMEPNETLGHEMIHGVHQGQGNDLVGEGKPSPYDNKEEMQTIGSNDGVDDYSGDSMTEGALETENGKSPRPDHDSITGGTYKDENGVWHEQKTDAAGNTTDTVIPGPPGGGPPSQ